MGEGDAWPAVQEQMLAADILVIASPTWTGHTSSGASRVTEQLDPELSETDNEARPETSGKIALVAVVGNEDGGHKITADLFQGLNDVGFTVPTQGVSTGTARPWPPPTSRTSTRPRTPSPPHRTLLLVHVLVSPGQKGRHNVEASYCWQRSAVSFEYGEQGRSGAPGGRGSYPCR